MDFKYFSMNGELLPIKQAVVPLSNVEYQYGFGVYENIRVNNGIPYFLKDHLVRLEESARIIGLEHNFDERFVEKSIDELIGKNGAGTYNLKILLIGGKEPSLNILCLNPLFPDKKLYTEGAAFITYEYERPLPHAKTLNMLQSYLAYKKAREVGAYDALLINAKGCITEGTRTNFFSLQDRTLVSPPESEILLGVTRSAVLKVAKEAGFSLEERDMSFSEATKSDGAFVTSTSSKIVPVRSIDGQAFGAIPEALKELMRAFDAFLSSCSGKLRRSGEY
ncbi:hypothetical protein A2853_00955 [Candidatus Kaiserbacteria bacterium RIFCSPHIGHO2_01_FULL_55_17]|uniref:Aminotransferase class IV n=1 Tax=Candidatus Kaiserbacteria bacterium RIFCSPHIGHO2_01_FULL_55_17 TaxID=1798484 RepID=A0A1F6D9P8_9BACT|nr:MAG: hypothetical protein A2853_00955 [Candidatus Kaiserbacteria bacterium RIFCSPHIGHO2_01_FULL_55_17]